MGWSGETQIHLPAGRPPNEALGPQLPLDNSLANLRAQDLTAHTNVLALDPEKIFTNDITKKLMSQIYKQLIQQQQQQKLNPIKIMDRISE